MKHTAKLNRNCGHRKALLVNLACSMIEHDQIKTTLVRAKELRRFVERLITTAKAGSTGHQKQLASAALKINTPMENAQTKKLVLDKLFTDLAVRFAKRPGGYTRIIRLAFRKGDSAKLCLIQFVEAGSDRPEASKEPKEKKSAGKKSASKKSGTAGAKEEKTPVKMSAEKKPSPKKSAAEKTEAKAEETPAGEEKPAAE